MRIIFVRHGQSVGNTEKGRISGAHDTRGLTTLGALQILRTSRLLEQYHIDAIYTSPVARALETSKIIWNMHAYVEKPRELDWLAEIHYGIYEGQMWQPQMEIKTVHTRYPQGESISDVYARVAQGIERLMQSHGKDATIMCISHQLPIACAIQAFISYGAQINDITKVNALQVPNGGIIIGVDINNARNIEQNSYVQTLETPPKEYIKSYVATLLHRYNEADITLKTIPTLSGNQIISIQLSEEQYILKIRHTKTFMPIQDIQAIYATCFTNTKKSAIYDTSHAFIQQDTDLYPAHGIVLNEVVDFRAKHKQYFADIFETILHFQHIDYQEFIYTKQYDAHIRWKQFILPHIAYCSQFFGTDMILEELQKRIETKTYTQSLIHGDVSMDNMVYDQTKIYLIDYDRSQIGDPLWDYAYLYGMLDNTNYTYAHAWGRLLQKNLSPSDMHYIFLYRILFHVWTIRDGEGPSELRKKRADSSKHILYTLLQSFRAQITI